jgi:hypothetical protein
MANIHLGGLVQGLGVGLQQGQNMANNARQIRRIEKQDQRADEQYERQTKIQGEQDAFRTRVKDTLKGIKPGDDYTAATTINDLVLEGSLVDPEGSRALLPMAEIHMKKHLENVARDGVAALQTGDAQKMAELNEKFPGSQNIDKNEDGTYIAAFDPATKSFQFSIGGKPVQISQDQAATMVQSLATPEAAIASLKSMTQANVKEVGGGLYDVRSNKWLVEPKGEKPTIVDNGGENAMVDSKGNVLATFKKTAEPVKTSVVKHEGGGGRGGGRQASGVQSRVQNSDGTWTLIMRDGSTQQAVDKDGKPITGVTPEQLKRLELGGRVYTNAVNNMSDNPTGDAVAAGNIPLPAPGGKPAAAGGVITPNKKPTVSNW